MAHNTITLSNIDIYNDILSIKPTIITYEVDPIAIACARYSIQKTTKKIVMMDDIHVSMVSDEDFAQARLIREHYSKKLTIAILSDEKCSEYRKSLAKYLSSEDPKKIDINDIKIVYKLPEQYEYDLSIEQMRDEHFKTSYSGEDTMQEYDLIPVKRLSRKTTRSKSIVYWFKVADSNAPVTMTIESNNVLIHLFNNVFDTFKSVKITGKYRWKESKDGFNFYILSDWGLNSKIISGD